MNVVVETVIDIINSKGLKAALQLLNERVPHRWTAIYKLDQGVMHNLQIVDKENAVELGDLAAFELKDSFCQFAISDGKFVSANTGEDLDERLIGHRYKGVVNAYVGLPLVKGFDEIYGTFCHFDLVHQSISDDEFAFLQQVTRILPRYLDRTSP